MGGINFKETLIFDLAATSELVPYSPRRSEGIFAELCSTIDLIELKTKVFL